MTPASSTRGANPSHREDRLTEAEITERIKELAAKHGMDAAKLLGGNVALPPKA